MPGSASLGLRAFSDSQNLLCPHTRQTRSTRELTPKDWWQLVYKFSSSFVPQATYNSAFTFCLCRAQGPARGAGLRLSRVFCEHASWPWACKLHSEFPSIHSSHSNPCFPENLLSQSSSQRFWSVFRLSHLLSLALALGSYRQYIFKCFQ